MNVVIMGVDNTGKTTLGLSLERDLKNAKYIHSLGKVPLEDMIKFMDSELVSDKDIIKIFDRFPVIEEEIYGKILRRCNKFDLTGLTDKYLNEVDLFIYCNPGFETILKWNNREQMDGVIDNINVLYSAFSRLANRLKENYKVIEYNFLQEDNYNKVLEAINEYFGD